jgi:N-hydroxyarylamine O-acetyltransferase
MFDVDAYLARIRMPARPTLDAAGLQRHQHAHRLAIPFENLDIWLGRPVAIDSAAVFAKLVTARRGGYCFEHNRLFLDALAELGFVAEPLLARVWLGADAVPPRTHTFARVTLGGQDWIADAGFGGSYVPPLPLAGGAEATAPDGARFLLKKDDAGWMLFRDGDPATTDGRGGTGGWQPQYGFTGETACAADLLMGNHWSATAPVSRFTRHRIVSIILPHGFASLTDREYRRKAGDTATQDTITNPRVYRMRLSLMFGIDLSAEEVARVFPPD